MALNNADASMEYVDALCDNILKEIEQALPNMTANEKGKLESCLSGLSSATANLKEIIDYGMQQLHVGAVKPRVSPWVDAFLNMSHHLTEASYLLITFPFVTTKCFRMNCLLMRLVNRLYKL